MNKPIQLQSLRVRNFKAIVDSRVVMAFVLPYAKATRFSAVPLTTTRWRNGPRISPPASSTPWAA